MKQKIRNIFNDLMLAKDMPESDIKNRQIDDFFTRVKGLGLENNLSKGDVIILKQENNKGVLTRTFLYSDKKNTFLVHVMINTHDFKHDFIHEEFHFMDTE